MKNMRITITLNDRQAEFLKWQAKRDNLTEREELASIFWMEFDHEFELYKDEMEAE